MSYHPGDEISDERWAAIERAKVPARVKACREALVVAITAAATRGVPLRRSEYTVEWSDTGPVSCSPLGAAVLDVPPSYHEAEIARLLGLTTGERWAVEAGFAGWNQEDYDPRWYAMGQGFAIELGLECPEIAGPEVRGHEPPMPETMLRAERMRR